MAKAVYEPNLAATRRFMQSAQMMEVITRAALKAKAYAESISPVRTGAYRSSFQVSARVIGNRAMAVLENTAPYAVIVEVYNNGGERVLGRAVDHIEAGG